VRLSSFSIKGEIPMAETKDPGHQKTLEMRVAELEDKLAQLHISEEEMKTYQKVASKLGAATPCQQCTASPCIAAAQQQQPCVAAQQAQQPCIASQQLYPIYYRCYYYNCYYYRCYYYNDCILAQGPTNPAAGGGGGFGGFGT
jgi:hypothetical protein